MAGNNGSGKKSALSEFFKKNKSLTVLLPVLLVGVIAVVIIYTSQGNQSKPASAGISPTKAAQQANNTNNNNNAGSNLTGPSVEILPKMERNTKPDVSIDANMKDPFASDEPVMRLKGIMLSGENSTAIIEAENTALVVCAGDKIGDAWSVVKIEAESVVLKGREGNETVLKFE